MSFTIVVPASLIAAALLLIGAGGKQEAAGTLPAGYWQNPSASEGRAAPDHWSSLEADLHPEACAQCHRSQFDAWRGSRHAHAFSPGMIGQFPSLGVKKANGCLVCHAPLQEQRYADMQGVRSSLALMLGHQDGFNADADMDQATLPLRHAGVTCAACHVRGWQRFGPPLRSGSDPQSGAAHQGFTAINAFESSSFCASCHQFPASMAINGKPIENTLNEWKNSDFGRRSITCQQCHMPDRRHEFRGIHDAGMVRSGLDISLARSGNTAVLRMRSKWIGHAFPTYVTPKVVIRAEAVDRAGAVIRSWQWEIWRKVAFDHGWKELSDTRLMPGEERAFIASPLSRNTVAVRYRVLVIPDAYYKGLYQQLAQSSRHHDGSKHIRLAAEQADQNDYTLFEGQLQVSPRQ
ncbi:hypothetical protein FE236_10695 [Mariprofundus erugo]|uniref:multiheme c-type cytochrome n=1 Tax=Mariprofundus erugo TaxID=2528639 RepID=UPI0010FE062F|nr:multiheme c-type cytochrome [Mariprofundus erugo]TLS74872.1 hypothetical protein FE236_10695 [Mariprofundus erugo]